MGDNKMSLLFNAKIRSFEKLNENFMKAKCYVMALGKNQNKSHFSKENVDRAYPSLAYVPVIGHLMTDENGVHYLGGHDVKLDLDNMSFKSQCVPFGVAIPSEEPVYEDVTESDGTVSTYLVSDVVIWIGRYPELTDAFFDEETYFSHSMEILYSNSEKLKDDPIYTDIIDFSFDALCMLNKSDDPKFNVLPCFPSSSFKPITYGINKDEFSELMNEMKEQLSFCLNKNSENEGGKTLDEKNKVLQKYGKTIEDLDFSINDMSLEDLSTKMEELFGEKTSKPVAFSATYNQKREALRNALDPIIVKDADGNYIEETYFYVSDFDDEHVFVEVDHWSSDSDYNCKYGRYSYTFDDTTITAIVADDFEEMVKVWMTIEEKAKLDADRSNYETISTEFETYKNEHSHDNAEFESLETFKQTVADEKRKSDIESTFAKFDKKLSGYVEYETLKTSEITMDITDLEEKLFAMIGKKTANFSVAHPKETVVTVPVEQFELTEDDGYGGILAKKYNK